MCRDVSNNDTEELFAQRIFEIYTFAKFSNQILNHVTVFKEEVNSNKGFRKWLDDDMVIINNVELDVTYDCRRVEVI